MSSKCGSVYNIFFIILDSQGFNYIKIFTVIQEMVEQRINNNTSSLGGKSTVVLFVPYSSPSSEEQKTFITQRKEIFRTYLPGRFLCNLKYSINKCVYRRH